MSISSNPSRTSTNRYGTRVQGPRIVVTDHDVARIGTVARRVLDSEIPLTRKEVRALHALERQATDIQDRPVADLEYTGIESGPMTRARVWFTDSTDAPPVLDEATILFYDDEAPF